MIGLFVHTATCCGTLMYEIICMISSITIIIRIIDIIIIIIIINIILHVMLTACDSAGNPRLGHDRNNCSEGQTRMWFLQ